MQQSKSDEVLTRCRIYEVGVASVPPPPPPQTPRWEGLICHTLNLQHEHTMEMCCFNVQD